MDTRGLLGAGTQAESQAAPPYDPVHSSTARILPLLAHPISPPNFPYAVEQTHQDGVNTNTLPTIPSMNTNNPMFMYSNFPPQASSVGLGPQNHFINFSNGPWPAPGTSGAILPFHMPHTNHTATEAPTGPNEPESGRGHLTFPSASAPGAGGHGNTMGTHSLQASDPLPSSNLGPSSIQPGPQSSLSNLVFTSNAQRLGRGHPDSRLNPTSTQSAESAPTRHPRPSTNISTPSTSQPPTIRLISPPALDRRRQQFLHHRSRRAMSSHAANSAQAHRVERGHASRNAVNASYTSRSTVDGSRRYPASLGLPRDDPSLSRDIQRLRDALGSDKRVASKHALRAMKVVHPAELPEDERTCIICYNNYGTPSPEGITEVPLRLAKCKHIFGSHCIRKWFEESDNCPYCRDKVHSEPKHRSDQLARVVDYARANGLLRVGQSSEELMDTLLHHVPEMRRGRDSPSSRSAWSTPLTDVTNTHNRSERDVPATSLPTSRAPTDSHEGYTPSFRGIFTASPPLPRDASPLSQDSLEDDLSTGSTPTPPATTENANALGRDDFDYSDMPPHDYLHQPGNEMDLFRMRAMAHTFAAREAVPSNALPRLPPAFSGSLSVDAPERPVYRPFGEGPGLGFGSSFGFLPREDRSQLPSPEVSPARGQDRRVRPW